MTNEPIDWTQPLVTNLGHPACVSRGPDEHGLRIVAGIFDESGGENWWCFNPDGTFEGGGRPYYVRNVRPGDPEPTPDLAAELAEALRAIKACYPANSNACRIASNALAKWEASK